MGAELYGQVTMTSTISAKPFIGCSSDSRPREERSIEEVYGSNGIQLDEAIRFVMSAPESDIRASTLEDKEQLSPVSSPPCTSARVLRKRYHIQSSEKMDLSHEQQQKSHELEERINRPVEVIGKSLGKQIPTSFLSV